jgi:uncharacterized membrane protein
MERSAAARFGAAGFWLLAGTMHFVIPRQYEAIVPPRIAGWKKEVVVVSGIAEMAGALAILPERTRRGARWCFGNCSLPRLALYVRLPIQDLFALLTWRGTR